MKNHLRGAYLGTFIICYVLRWYNSPRDKISSMDSLEPFFSIANHHGHQLSCNQGFCIILPILLSFVHKIHRFLIAIPTSGDLKDLFGMDCQDSLLT